LAEIAWTKDAVDDLGKLDRPIRKRILTRISRFNAHFEEIIAITNSDGIEYGSVKGSP
jgi:mRNA-degrading endonuclease RelE of RelBE toxin-antitoxin system